jgi:protein-disulfide isomerase
MQEDIAKLSPKTTFIGGLVFGFLLLCSIGFFILLFTTLHKKDTTQKPAQVVAGDQVNNEPKEINFAEITDTDHIRGKKDATVTILTYSDIECPYCKTFHLTMLNVMKKYGDRIRWIFRNSPLDGLHQYARPEAEAAECVGDLGGNDIYWQYLDKLYATTQSNDGLDQAELPKIAEGLKINKDAFNKCVADKKFAEKVQTQALDAQDAGMEGTPYSIAISGDQKIPLSGAYSLEQVSQILDGLLK